MGWLAPVATALPLSMPHFALAVDTLLLLLTIGVFVEEREMSLLWSNPKWTWARTNIGEERE